MHVQVGRNAVPLSNSHRFPVTVFVMGFYGVTPDLCLNLYLSGA